MQPDPEDEYFLGSDDDERGDDGRTRRHALIGLAAVVVIVTVAITLTSLFVDTSSAGRGPQGAARAWGTALVHGDTAARHRLECAKGASVGVTDLVVDGATGVSAGAADQLATDRWSVAVDIDGPDGRVQDSVSVTVVRESGRYLVC